MTGARVFRLPDVGEGLTEAEILRWLVRVGDRVEVNAALVEIETAKASVELPSPYAGVIEALHVDEGVIVAVGTPIVSIATDDAADAPAADPSPSAGEPAAAREAVLVGYGVATGSARRRRRAVGGAAPARPPSVPGAGRSRPRAKPLVRRLARELGVDLSAVPPSGPNGDVTRADVLAAQGRSATGAALPAGERVAVRGVRRAMASAMSASVASAPQAAVWVEVDITAGRARLDALRDLPQAHGVRLSPLVLAAAALVDAVREQPLLHGVWNDAPAGPEIVLPDEVGLGIAADTGRGLVVPVVREPQTDDLVALARRIQDAVSLARTGQARPADFLGGTVTLTNVGVFGIDGGLPILTPGQAAILAMGQVAQRPWVVDGQVAVRPVVQLTMAFDHRVLDGAQASAALASIATALAT
ncbi:MAG: dihydrolipoamide acetyltransferase family protein [Candidatus Nanopelagicales bacterium]